MAVKIVQRFVMSWSHRSNNRMIEIELDGGQKVRLQVDGPAEFSAIAAILRESPVWYDSQSGILTTGPETVGG